MAAKEFVGVVEHLMERPFEVYCVADLGSGSLVEYFSLGQVAEYVASNYGPSFEGVLFEPPEDLGRRASCDWCKKNYRPFSEEEFSELSRLVKNIL